MVHKFTCRGDIEQEETYIVKIYEEKDKSWYELHFNNEEEWDNYEPAKVIYYFINNDDIVECIKLEETYYKFSDKDDSVIFMTEEEYIKKNFKKELFEEVLGYWIEYNHSFSIPLKNGGRKEGKETFTWLDEDNTQMNMLYQ